jgi:hypothetical protein
VGIGHQVIACLPVLSQALAAPLNILGLTLPAISGIRRASIIRLTPVMVLSSALVLPGCCLTISTVLSLFRGVVVPVPVSMVLISIPFCYSYRIVLIAGIWLCSCPVLSLFL